MALRAAAVEAVTASRSLAGHPNPRIASTGMPVLHVSSKAVVEDRITIDGQLEVVPSECWRERPDRVHRSTGVNALNPLGARIRIANPERHRPTGSIGDRQGDRAGRRIVGGTDLQIRASLADAAPEPAEESVRPVDGQ